MTTPETGYTPLPTEDPEPVVDEPTSTTGYVPLASRQSPTETSGDQQQVSDPVLQEAELPVDPQTISFSHLDFDVALKTADIFEPTKVTIAFIQEPLGGYEDARYLIQVGFAWCSPEDNFCREDGRRLALKRLMNNPFQFAVDSDKSHREIKRIVKDFIVLGVLEGVSLPYKPNSWVSVW